MEEHAYDNHNTQEVIVAVKWKKSKICGTVGLIEKIKDKRGKGRLPSFRSQRSQRKSDVLFVFLLASQAFVYKCTTELTHRQTDRQPQTHTPRPPPASGAPHRRRNCSAGDCLVEDGAVAGIPGSTLANGGRCRWRVSR